MVDVVPVFAEYEGTEPLAFVVSHNLHRRHLNESQRGMVGAKLANLQKGDNQHSSIGLYSPPVTQNQAAEMLNVSPNTIKRSKKVLTRGIPELQDMHMSGEVSAKAASEVAKLPEEEHRTAVAGGVAGVKALAKKQSDSGTRSKTSSESQEISHAESKSDLSPKNQRVPKWIPDDARRLWLLAKTDLDKILKNDISRESTLREVIQYAQNRIDNNI
jgi:hypothetical protein